MMMRGHLSKLRLLRDNLMLPSPAVRPGNLDEHVNDVRDVWGKGMFYAGCWTPASFGPLVVHLALTLRTLAVLLAQACDALSVFWLCSWC